MRQCQYPNIWISPPCWEAEFVLLIEERTSSSSAIFLIPVVAECSLDRMNFSPNNLGILVLVALKETDENTREWYVYKTMMIRTWAEVRQCNQYVDGSWAMTGWQNFVLGYWTKMTICDELMCSSQVNMPCCFVSSISRKISKGQKKLEQYEASFRQNHKGLGTGRLVIWKFPWNMLHKRFWYTIVVRLWCYFQQTDGGEWHLLSICYYLTLTFPMQPQK